MTIRVCPKSYSIPPFNPEIPEETMSRPIRVGIDFGTTNCTVGLLREDGGVSVVGPFPSVGAWSNGAVVFGEDALGRILSGDPSVYPIRDLKLALGTDRRIHAEATQLNPVEMATELFRALANRYFPNRIPETVVVGTPVRMSRKHRSDLRSAAIAAGYKTVQLVYEPTAALVGRGDLNQLSGLNHVLVVDWGGGTLDIAVVRVHDRVFREIAVGGDIADLGGSRLDAELARRLLGQHGDLNEAALAPGTMDRFKSEVEREKIDIFSDFEGESGESRLFRSLALDRTFRLEPGLVYDVGRQFARRAVSQIQEMLKRSNISLETVSHLLLCGGGCQAGVIRAEVLGAFPNAIEITTDTPQLLTGRGCSLLLATGFHLELGADFASRQADDSLCILLRRGQRIDSNRYRTAEFLVTDVLASEAVFEFGICQLEDHQQSLLAVDSGSFVSLGNVFVRVAAARLNDGYRAPDVVQVHVGLDENLTVGTYLRSHGGGQSGGSAREFYSGVPLAICIGDGK